VLRARSQRFRVIEGGGGATAQVKGHRSRFAQQVRLVAYQKTSLSRNRTGRELCVPDNVPELQGKTTIARQHVDVRASGHLYAVQPGV
jgi:hypothetical protein